MVDKWEEGQRPPTASEKKWEQFLVQSLGVTSLLIGVAVCLLIGAEMEQASTLSLEPEEIEAIAQPSSRLLARSGISKEVSNKVLSSGDYIQLGTALTFYALRIWYFMQQNAGVTNNVQQPTHAAQPVQATTAASNGHDYGYLANFGAFSATP